MRRASAADSRAWRSPPLSAGVAVVRGEEGLHRLGAEAGAAEQRPEERDAEHQVAARSAHAARVSDHVRVVGTS